jgi:hypothetical protein
MHLREGILAAIGAGMPVREAAGHRTFMKLGHRHLRTRPFRVCAPAQGSAILQSGLYAQLRSSPTTHHSTPQVAPIIPMSSPME